MTEKDGDKFPPTSRVEKRRAETDKVFAELQEKERAERRAKTLRLRSLRLVNHNNTGSAH